MLELRPNCELCDVDLPPHATNARICTYECTFCVDCVDGVLFNVCPNCGGNFEPRPLRPAESWRPGTGLAKHPARVERATPDQSDAARAELSARLRYVAPQDR